MKTFLVRAVAALGIGISASAVRAASVAHIEGLGQTGASYSASLSYDDGSSMLTVSLQNTSSASLGGNITAFVFNIAGGDYIDALTPDPTDLDATSPMKWWSLTDVAQLTDLESGSPFGKFEAGAGAELSAAEADFNGGGNGTNAEGIAPGETGVFQFYIAKADQSGAGGALSASSFVSELSTDTNKPSLFLVRFKGLGPGGGGSDKVTATVVPLPASVWAGMALMGALGAGKWIRHRRQA